MLDIKRNIFQSSTKMPDHNETISAAIQSSKDAGWMPYGTHPDYDVRHAPVPRLGEQK